MTWSGPYEIVNPHGRGGMVVVCDHASNVLPPELPDLGVSAHDMRRHIAWDIGAGPIARRLSALFDAPAVLCGTSRLVIDCNRRPGDPTLVPAISDGTRIPANEDLPEAERARRVETYYRTYHEACRRVLDARCRAGERPLFVSVHSMTDRMNGHHRPWEISFSSNEERGATAAVIAALRRVEGLMVGDNEPYDMNPAEDYTTPEHALARGLNYLQVEFRQDLVADETGQARFATLLADAIRQAGVLPG